MVNQRHSYPFFRFVYIRHNVIVSNSQLIVLAPGQPRRACFHVCNMEAGREKSTGRIIGCSQKLNTYVYPRPFTTRYAPKMIKIAPTI